MATTVDLNNGHKMPVVALGTLRTTEEELVSVLNAALEAGYRHIDTAIAYENEAIIGKVLKQWFDSGKLKREDVFITTKTGIMGNDGSFVEENLKLSLEALQLSYVDLYLLHSPMGIKKTEEIKVMTVRNQRKTELLPKTDHVVAWKAMEAQVDAGRARSIGLSNFNSRQIKRIVQVSRIRPVNLQVELHAYMQQRELVAFCRALDIVVSAYGSLGSPGLSDWYAKNVPGVNIPKKDTPISDPVVKEIASKYNKTPGQILLRHIIQRGIVVIPKSSKPTRVQENFNIFDFELKQEDVEKIDAIDKGRKGRLFAWNTNPENLKNPEYPFNEPY